MISLPVVIESSFLIVSYRTYRQLFGRELPESGKIDPTDRGLIRTAQARLENVRLKTGNKDTLVLVPSHLRLLGLNLDRPTALEIYGPADKKIDSLPVMIYQVHLRMTAREEQTLREIVHRKPIFVSLGQKRHQNMLVGPLKRKITPSENFCLYIDRDLATACLLRSGDRVELYLPQDDESISTAATEAEAETEKSAPKKSPSIITENDIRVAWRKKEKIRLEEGQMITPAAKDLGKALGVLER